MIPVAVKMIDNPDVLEPTRALSGALAHHLLGQQAALEDLSCSPNVICATDFSTVTLKSYKTYVSTGVLLITVKEMARWMTGARADFRRKDRFTGERVSYKKVSDRTDHLERLSAFLECAGRIKGILITITVPTDPPYLFSNKSDLATNPNLAHLESWDTRAFESLVRTANLLMVCCTPFLRENQTLCWLCDNDELFANERHGDDTVGFVRSYLKGVVCRSANIGAITPSSVFLNNPLAAEDLLSVTDIVAGAMGDITAMSERELGSKMLEGWHRVPAGKTKSNKVVDWLSDESLPLVRLCLSLDPRNGLAKATYFGRTSTVGDP